MSNFCTSCGAAITPEQETCGNCGVELVQHRGRASSPSVSTEISTKVLRWGGLAAAIALLFVGKDQYDNAKQEWFAPASQNGVCGYITFGGKFEGFSQFRKTGFFDENGMTTVLRDDGWRDVWNRLGGSGAREGANSSDNPDASADREWWLIGINSNNIAVFIDSNAMQIGNSPINTHDGSNTSHLYRHVEASGIGFEDGKGTVKIQPIYQSVTPFSYIDGNAAMAGAERAGAWGFVTEDGIEVGQFKYQAIQGGRDFPTHEEFWPVKQSGKWGVVKAQISVQPVEYITRLDSGGIGASGAAKRINFQTVVPFKFNYIMPYVSDHPSDLDHSDGSFLALSDAGWILIDETGKPINGEAYEDVGVPLVTAKPNFFQALASGNLSTLWQTYADGMNVIPIKKGGKWGLVTLKAKTLIEPNYDQPCGLISVNEAIGL